MLSQTLHTASVTHTGHELQHTKIALTLMVLTTQNIASGVTPRVHEPKGRANAKTKGKVSTKAAKPTKLSRRSKKCSANSEEEEEESMEESEPQARKKGSKRRRQDEDSDSEGGVEVIDVDVGPPEKETEEVDMEGKGDKPHLEEEVRTN